MGVTRSFTADDAPAQWRNSGTDGDGKIQLADSLTLLNTEAPGLTELPGKKITRGAA